MKRTHKFRIMLALGAGGILAGALSGCTGMWLGTDTDWNFTQPGGFGVNIGVSSPPVHIGRPIGGPIGGPGFLGPGNPGGFGGPGRPVGPVGPPSPPPPPPFWN